MAHLGYLPDCQCRHPLRVLLKVTFFRMSSEHEGGTSLQNSCIDELL